MSARKFKSPEWLALHSYWPATLLLHEKLQVAKGFQPLGALTSPFFYRDGSDSNLKGSARGSNNLQLMESSAGCPGAQIRVKPSEGRSTAAEATPTGYALPGGGCALHSPSSQGRGPRPKAHAHTQARHRWGDYSQ